MSPSTNRKAKAAIYRKAARLIDEERVQHGFSCHAIVQAMTGEVPALFIENNYPECVAYGNALRPAHADSGNLWFSNLLEGWSEENSWKERRVLLLCFMAAMVEAGDA